MTAAALQHDRPPDNLSLSSVSCLHPFLAETAQHAELH